MKRLSILVAIALSTVFQSVVAAQNQAVTPQSSQTGEALLERMLDAEKHLAFSGDQITTLYRPERTFSATQSIERIGDHDLKLEYNSPQQVAGDVYVDNGKVAWDYIPASKKLEVGVSGLDRFRQRSEKILESLNSHELSVQVIGQDTVAGQSATIIQVTDSAHAWGEHKYWIDNATGAQLKIQSFGGLGQLISETSFTKISYQPSFDRSDFGPPKVGDDVVTVPMIPRGSQTVSGLPTDVECGFTPLLPSFVPAGFNFQSALVMPIEGQKLVGLTYTNELLTLSIFEQPIDTKPGKPTPRNDFRTPRQGVLTAKFNGYRFIVIGSLPEDVMEQIVQSMH